MTAGTSNHSPVAHNHLKITELLNYMHTTNFVSRTQGGVSELELEIRLYTNYKKVNVLTLTVRQQYYSPQQRNR